MRRILWFRRDLRSDDNRLLACGGEVLPIFIFDPAILDALPRDDRRVAFIFERVAALKEGLQAQGLDLAIFYGAPEAVFKHLIAAFEPDEVCASGDYDAYAQERDRAISMLLPFRFLHDTYLFEPHELLKEDGSPYLVFTPFYKAAKARFRPEHLQAAEPANAVLLQNDCEGITRIDGETHHSLPMTLESLGFESVAHGVPPLDALMDALKKKLPVYAEERDRLDVVATSELSVHLRFGTLGVRRLLRFLAEWKKRGTDTEPFFRQLVFRDFYAAMLYHFPRLATENFRHPFAGVTDDDRHHRFCEGRTGFPVVDAGIRELLQTGKMHNRARMICASFYTKDLLLPWQWGEAFFARHLLDYDAASNILSWQWSSGTGVDPQPYFRIFNPWLQSKKFDPEGSYIRRWIPELAEVEARRLHDEAWMCDHPVAGYVPPMVRHKAAAQRALEYFKSVSKRTSPK